MGKLLVQNALKHIKRCYRNSLLSQSRYFSTEIVTEEKRESAPAPKRKVSKPPFVKNLFLGVYDVDALIYPETLSNDRLSDLEQMCLTAQSALENVTRGQVSDASSTNSNLNIYKDLGFFGLRVPRLNGGLELNATEYARVSEVIGQNVYEALLLEYHNSLIVNTIMNFGSKEQKEKYLSRLASGEILGGYAMCEENSGSDPGSITTIAELSRGEQEWTINGDKLWVTNAEAVDFFIVFAKTKIENRVGQPYELSTFIVEKGSPGVSIEPHQTVGLEGFGLCKVHFKNVVVPKENLIGNQGDGYDVAVNNLSSFKVILPQAISVNLKKLFSQTTEYIKHRKQVNMDLKDSEIIQKSLSKISSTIYALDSMIYLTAGIADQYDNPDITLESAIIQVFSFERGMEALNNCLTLLGAKSYDKSCPYSKLWWDLKGVTLSVQTVDIHKLFISMIGVQYAASKINELVMKMRNPLNFPGFALNKMLNSSRQSRDNPKLHLQLYMQLHPSLKTAAEQLEYAVLRLQFGVETMLARHGTEIVHRQLELRRLSDVVIDIFAMGSMLARASRSYCTGIRNNDQEIISAIGFCQDAFRRVKTNMKDVIEGGLASNDIPHLKLASSIFKSNGYIFEHPLVRNIH